MYFGAFFLLYIENTCITFDVVITLLVFINSFIDGKTFILCLDNVIKLICVIFYFVIVGRISSILCAFKFDSVGIILLMEEIQTISIDNYL